MKSLKISNEVRLIDLLILLGLALIGFSLYFKNHAIDYADDFLKLNVRFDNLQNFLEEPIEVDFNITNP